MRILGVTETCDLGSLYLRLQDEGHDVRLFVDYPLAEGTLAGMVPRTADWRADLDWIREAGSDGIVIFEAVSEGLGAIQDDLRRQGYNVVGGSAFGDRLENDRAFAFRLLADAGLSIAPSSEFGDAAAAEAFVRSRPARYVLKFSGPDYASSDNFVGQMPDGRDVLAVLKAKMNAFDGDARFVLMDHLDGIEMGVGAFFNGETFLTPACLDWEHKRFFAGDLGELTGEMGTVATFDCSQLFFERTLARLQPFFREAGHVGWVNLNTIVNEEGIWPLEFTCRFGYPGYSILEPLQGTGWGELLKRLCTRSDVRFPTHPGFSVGVVVSTPPFPYSREEVSEPVGLPILTHRPWSEEDRRHIHYGEVGLCDGQLVTSGLYGWTVVATGVADEIGEAQRQAYERCRNFAIPNMRYRLDIGERLRKSEWDRLEALGYLS